MARILSVSFRKSSSLRLSATRPLQRSRTRFSDQAQHGAGQHRDLAELGESEFALMEFLLSESGDEALRNFVWTATAKRTALLAGNENALVF